MFSATFADDVEKWCKLNLDNVVSVSVGARNSAVDTVQQELKFVGNEYGKLVAIRNLIQEGFPTPALVFVQTKERAKELLSELIYTHLYVDAIHSERSQLERDNAVKAFREGKLWILICTEVLGRGIDFKGVNMVLNYDFPPSVVSYIHRIGRTGRAGREGQAVTYFTEQDVPNLRSIAQVIKDAGCPVPEFIFELPKASKFVKRQWKQRPPKRETISTIPRYEKEKAERKKKLIKKSLKMKKQLKEVEEKQET
ncbi:DEAD (Asp-Glu-Ala-Asp) box polypeptide 52 [Chamberlinius hualienensis]